MQAQIIYPKDSIGISCPIRVNGVTITTTYAADAIMNDSTVGKGIAWLTVFDAAGAIVTNAAGVVMQNIFMNCASLNGGVAVYTIGPGLATAGNYTAQPMYGVKNINGQLEWRRQTVIAFTVSAIAVSTDMPVS